MPDNTPVSTPPETDETRRDAQIEALLLTADRPVPAAKIAEVLASLASTEVPGTETPEIDPAAVEASVDRLNGIYEQTGRSFRVERIAGGLRVISTPDHATLLAAFHRQRSAAKLSRAALETLAVIAYRQPVTRANLEAIRGVACGEVLKTLLERRQITVAGRSEELGRPMLYATTKRFLDTFGLASIKELPEIKALVPREPDPAPQPQGSADG